jgi:hypothetical protein
LFIGWLVHWLVELEEQPFPWHLDSVSVCFLTLLRERLKSIPDPPSIKCPPKAFPQTPGFKQIKPLAIRFEMCRETHKFV